MNYVFISPAFPTNYYNFCDRLKRNGINVLGIGDTYYDNLKDEVKNSLTEYYRVNSLENYDEVYRAVAYFIHKYGRIDYIESNNEYWLKQDAKLREDFNVNGPRVRDVTGFTSKSEMKNFYIKAGVPVARFKISTNPKEDLDFINEVEYPVVIKPDVGVGASSTYKIHNEEEYYHFYHHKGNIRYLIEEFINGQIITFDGVCDKDGNIVFSDNMVMGNSLMDCVNNNLEVSYFINKECPKNLAIAGEKVIHAFNIKERYFHLEFFKLLSDKNGLGQKGDIVALEVNMRPPGGFSPDMINYSQSTDTYQIYADIIKHNKIINTSLDNDKFYCLYVGRRNRYNYRYNYDDIIRMYSNNVLIHDYMNECFSNAMGNEFYIAKFKTFEELKDFEKIVLEK